MAIRSVIIDDDDFCRVELRSLLKSYNDEVNILADFADPNPAIDFIRSEKPDLLFLDIQMPGMTGFQMLDQIDTHDFEVIFITSYNQYAIQAIKYSALDYLLKPIDAKELSAAISRFRERSEKILTRTRLANLAHNMSAGDEENFQLVIPTKQGEHQFAAQDIIHCEASSNYTMIHLLLNKKFLASKTLGDIEMMLSPEKFLRIHKSHLVNAAHISQLTSQDEVVMSNKTRLPVSRRRLNEVKTAVRGLN